METLTIIELADMINDHLAKGGLVMDAYRNDGQFPVSEARLEDDWHDGADSVLYLRCPNMAAGKRATISDRSTLEVHEHEVHYFSGGYSGKVVFLNPAPVDLTTGAGVLAAYAAYAAAVARCNRAIDDRDSAAEVAAYAANDAAEAADDAAAYATYAAEAAVEAAAAYAAMIAAKATADTLADL